MANKGHLWNFAYTYCHGPLLQLMFVLHAWYMWIGLVTAWLAKQEWRVIPLLTFMHDMKKPYCALRPQTGSWSVLQASSVLSDFVVCGKLRMSPKAIRSQRMRKGRIFFLLGKGRPWRDKKQPSVACKVWSGRQDIGSLLTVLWSGQDSVSNEMDIWASKCWWEDEAFNRMLVTVGIAFQKYLLQQRRAFFKSTPVILSGVPKGGQNITFCRSFCIKWPLPFRAICSLER